MTPLISPGPPPGGAGNVCPAAGRSPAVTLKSTHEGRSLFVGVQVLLSTDSILTAPQPRRRLRQQSRSKHPPAGRHRRVQVPTLKI
jgi:hypothetical protein